MRNDRTRAPGRRSRERGQSLAEYALILLLVATVCVAAATLLGANTAGFFASFAGNV